MHAEYVKIDIKCKVNQFIDILSVLYGSQRTQQNVPDKTFNEIYGDEQTQMTNEKVVKNECDSKEECEFTILLLTDPDPKKVYKHLKVKYECRDDCKEGERLNKCLPRAIENRDYSILNFGPHNFKKERSGYIIDWYIPLSPFFAIDKCWYDHEIEDGTVVLLSKRLCSATFFGKSIKIITKFLFGAYFTKFKAYMTVASDVAIDLQTFYQNLYVSSEPYILDQNSWIDSPKQLSSNFRLAYLDLIIDGKDMVSFSIRNNYAPIANIYCTTFEASKKHAKYKCADLQAFTLNSLESLLDNAIPSGYMNLEDLYRKLPFLKNTNELVYFQHAPETIEKIDFDLGLNNLKGFIGKKKVSEGSEVQEVRDYIEGGIDFAMVRFLTKKQDVENYFDYEAGEQIICKAKFFVDKIEVSFLPKITVKSANIQKIFNVDTVIPIAESYDMIMMTIHKENEKLCFNLKVSEDESLFGGMISISNTTFIYCKDYLNPPTVKCENNEELAFKTKGSIYLKQECNDGNCPFIFYGPIRIYEFTTLLRITPKSLKGNYKVQNRNIFNFPVKKLTFDWYHGNSYSRFDGEADFHGKPFRIQAVYKTKPDLAVCLEYTKVTEDKNMHIDNGPLAVLDLVKLLTKPDAIIRSFTNLAFDEIKMSFQSEKFYEDDVMITDSKLRCKEMKNHPVEGSWSGSDTMVVISAIGLTTRCDKLEKEYVNVCKFVRKGFGDEVKEKQYVGYFNGNKLEMRLSTKDIDTKFQLFPGFALTNYANFLPLMHVFSISTSKSNNAYDHILGNTESTIYPWLSNIAALINFRSGEVFFSFYTRDQDQKNFMGAMLITARSIVSERHQIDLKNFNHIELQCDIEVGTKRPILFKAKSEEGKLRTRQFLYSNKNKNKFWSCIDNTDAEVKDIVDEFSDLKRYVEDTPFYQKSIKSICVVYTQDSVWKIDEKGMTVTKGLSFYGKYKMNKLNQFNVFQSYELDFELHVTSRKAIFDAPPIFFGKFLAMQRSEDSPQFGPRFELKENKWTINGCIMIFGVKVANVVEFYNGDMIKPINSKEKHEGNEFARGFVDFVASFNNDLKVSFSYFKFDGEFLIPKVEKEFMRIRQNTATDVQRKIKNVKHILQGLLTRINSYKADKNQESEISSIVKKMSNISDGLAAVKEDLRKECIKECKMSKSPGFTWENCQLSREMGNVSCLKFKRNALPSTNMPCLADCEIKQAFAYGRSTSTSKLNQAHQYQELKKTVLKLSPPLELYKTLWTKVGSELKLTEKYIEDLEKSRGVIENDLPNEFNITGFTASYFANKLSKAKTWPLQDLKLTVTTKTKSFTDSYIFDENIATKIAMHRFESLKRKSFSSFTNDIKTAHFRLDLLKERVDSWEKLNHVELEQLRRDKSPAGKRSYINEMNLPETMSSFFIETKPSMEAAIKHFSPWIMLKKNNPLGTSFQQIASQKRDYLKNSIDNCSSRENKISMYKDMSLYMKSWMQAYDEGNTTLQKYQKDTPMELKRFSPDSSSKRSGDKPSNSTVDQMKDRWFKRLSNGFETWSKELKQQLNDLNSKGATEMMIKMNNIFTPNGHDTLLSYFQSSNDGVTNKRADDTAPLQQIEQTFANGLSNMKNLIDGKQMIQQIDHLVVQAEQTNARCHDEL